MAWCVDFIVSRNEFTQEFELVTEVTTPTGMTDRVAQRLTTSDQRRFSRSLLKLVEHEVQPNSNKGICQTGQHAIEPAPGLRHVDQSVGHGEIHRRVHQIKTESHQEAAPAFSTSSFTPSEE